MRRLGFAALLLGACTGRAEVEVKAEVSAPEAEVSAPKAEVAATVDPRSAYELAAAVAQAWAEPSLTRAQSLDQLAVRWEGKRYRWEVGVSAPLCRRADACNVLPFDYASQDVRIVQGWLPRLALSESSHADLLERCGPGLCVATVEATLETLVLSADDPTSLSFSDVSVLDVRERRETESWVRRKSDPRLAALRTRSAAR